MKNITLICAGGFSTSMLVSNMEEAAKDKGVDVVIRAIAESKFVEYENDTDILLLGPQVGYLLEEIKERYVSKKMKIAVIDSIDYGMMNGEKVLNDALNM
ncbi:PTS system cellobiose-specific IIB component [Clostridium saccharoperbutylacetonicum]|jgi:PTS system cellobiose-specific IIB component|uniref:Phosphotransferase system cellobiose-specific component IIB n=1 Tax=Clostridium saccharoperbutylacetonicum N1-4(HMT) TaxID=931276 RepID=M1MR79_9CLOT|nr:PTS sugar transporter subunit IIB [Clostridium saccharoperbutylacetonicum]AGF58668.1 phosphotransferase system cellobiose-specific component IIB [Clostridium saccharoperbutylacetonicum N1-4(HMT)]NRT60553.1 PTS system cellobiose-specific IIB component [Clostridium saccharoperbutylacetonicum]NSB23867.1 PTS system cellobiose-specific IIB component [Clostridium saccharoperbutylacetonicum]NSB43243.1 PTS system cellobiose-specific IIB component [Clostridium saccharoperbutylacetonicum]